MDDNSEFLLQLLLVDHVQMKQLVRDQRISGCERALQCCAGLGLTTQEKRI